VRIDERREVTQMLKLFTFVQIAADSLRRREEGQTMAEYGVVLAVITLAVIGAITLLSDNVRAAIENVAGILPGQHDRSISGRGPLREKGPTPMNHTEKELP
jgi:Flp pilus assembly pilin Flp